MTLKPEDLDLVMGVPGGVSIDRNNITLRFEQLAWLLDAARSEGAAPPPALPDEVVRLVKAALDVERGWRSSTLRSGHVAVLSSALAPFADRLPTTEGA